MISVIVPVYNVRKYLAECVDSILAQTYGDLEVLLIDDGSTDGSGELCDEYARKDGRVRVVHKENGGLASARNAGFAVFRGEYVACVDSDDWIDPRTYEIQLKAMEAEDADMVISGIRRYAGEKTLAVLAPPKRIVDAKQATELFLRLTGYMTSVWNKLYRREVLYGFQCTPYRCAEDVSTTPYAIHRCRRIAIIPDVLYFYRVRGGSITTKPYQSKQQDSLRSRDEASGAIRGWYPDLEDLICSFEARSTLRQLSLLVFSQPRSPEAEEELMQRIRKKRYALQKVGNIPYQVRLMDAALRLGLPFFRMTLKIHRRIFGIQPE